MQGLAVGTAKNFLMEKWEKGANVEKITSPIHLIPTFACKPFPA